MTFSPNQVLRVGHYFYEVKSVNGAGLGGMSLVELEPLTQGPGVIGSVPYDTTFVPEVILLAAVDAGVVILYAPSVNANDKE